MKVLASVVVLSMILAFTGCGEQQAPDSEDQIENTDQVENTDQTSLEPEAQNGIVLADGWVMTDAVSAAEVEAIMGTSGFGVFPEASSSASSGRPVGSYNVSDIPYSKVRFEVNVNGGMDCYETAVGYLDDPSDVECSMWDMATLGDVTAGERTPVRIVVLKDDLCAIIAWEPEVFPDLDRTETCQRLAEMLIGNIYGL